MFILLDPLGLVTWNWKKVYNSSKFKKYSFIYIFKNKFKL